jgi:hypothetical protein
MSEGVVQSGLINVTICVTKSDGEARGTEGSCNQLCDQTEGNRGK